MVLSPFQQTLFMGSRLKSRAKLAIGEFTRSKENGKWSFTASIWRITIFQPGKQAAAKRSQWLFVFPLFRKFFNISQLWTDLESYSGTVSANIWNDYRASRTIIYLTKIRNCNSFKKRTIFGQLSKSHCLNFRFIKLTYSFWLE